MQALFSPLDFVKVIFKHERLVRFSLKLAVKQANEKEGADEISKRVRWKGFFSGGIVMEGKKEAIFSCRGWRIGKGMQIASRMFVAQGHKAFMDG